VFWQPLKSEVGGLGAIPPVIAEAKSLEIGQGCIKYFRHGSMVVPSLCNGMNAWY
jgi:hypothetical protein